MAVGREYVASLRVQEIWVLDIPTYSNVSNLIMYIESYWNSF
jgi:hypothetical protein